MKPYARWIQALGLPFLAFLSALGWFPLRAAIVQALLREGVEREIVGTLSSASLLGLLGGGLAAGVFALGTPWVPLLLGLALAGMGGLLVVVVPLEFAPLAMGLAAFGHAMAVPAAYGAAARALDGPRAHLRDGVFVAAYAATNVGALSSTVLSGSEVMQELGRGVVVGSVAVHLGAFVVAAVLAGAAFAGRVPDEPKPPARPMHLGAVAALALLVGVPWAACQSGWDFLEQRDLGEHADLIFSVNPIVVVSVGALLTLAFPIAHALGVRRFPTLVLVGAGLLLTGATTLGMTLLDDASLPTVVLTIGIGALGEALVLPLLFSRLAADLPYRLGTMAIALFLAQGHIFHGISRLFDDPMTFTRSSAYLGVGTAVLVGLVLLVGGAPARRLFEPPSERITP